ncbi:hypothetical protein NIES2100_05550 [Calothrix sp. NIES-2100]|uniref:terminase large subunit domain-containing protein n=1 Tax=Calothrix sp. NIES-2100 TaxID=1954172 RepID=UPI000B600FBD|nr:hypothetical protein NIES2100_05550 [Calothrix sp. NIES-2100]
MKIILETKIKPKTVLNINKTSLDNIDKISREVSDCLPEDNKLFRELPPILFPYQQQFYKAAENPENKILIWEKSRRIGATWALAAYAVLTAAKQNGKNFYYIGTSLSMAKEFLESCSYWVKHFQLAASEIKEDLYESEKDSILSLRINFKSNKKVMALSSKPSSIRGLQGNVLCDEFSFLTNPLEFLKAVKSMLIWGCKVFIVSTHNGIDNPFNELCEAVNKGEEKYYKQKNTFKDAVNQGLYQRICLTSGQPWTKENENKWVSEIYEQYGDGASEELDTIPAVSNANSIFKASWFKKISQNDLPKYFDYQVIAWDFAATDKDTSCYTVGVLIGKYKENFYILNWYPCKKDAHSTQNYVISTVEKQPKSVPVFIELEGGSQSILWLENSFKPLLKAYRVRGVKPEGSKAIRALPCAEAAEKGKFYIVNEPWSDDFLKVINQFEGVPGVPLISDTGDALSLAFTQVNKGVKNLMGT